jgi:cysteinyl-tRNA synthetase
MSDSTEKKSLHPWRMPTPFCSTLEVMEKMYPLVVMNSLTRTKTRFIPKDPNKVLWYQCGPTVYSDSHIGHARTYVSLDIIKRITKDYLNYNVVLVQNVTDIDDKIIIRSNEQKIPFDELARKYEDEYNDDMLKLGVPPPDIVTRVSEFIPDIVKYIQVLVDKGIAYAAGGSVYFSTKDFEAQGHTYGKLMPESIGNVQLIAEGEGALVENSDKKATGDFVLWKKTKIHADGMFEPSWESPWGPGRPGWHIECSVMANSVAETMDVHAGGVDLKFPHHENEIAQSEAYSGSHQWVNYWVHTGHVNIKGLKMSKSLKNFITIRQALEVHTARQIRFCFLLHKYNSPMDYGDNTMVEAVNMEKTFNEYFHNVKALLRRIGTKGNQKIANNDQILLDTLEECKASVRAALMDDFDTPLAISHLASLVRENNKYFESEGDKPSGVVATVARYITHVLRVFGLISAGTDIGFPLESADGGESSKEEILTPYLDVMTKFRESVRIAAIGGGAKAVLTAADELRDLVLPEVGVRMEDQGSGLDVVTKWKLDDPEAMRKERAQKEEAKLEKEKAKAEAKRKQLEKEEKAKIPPQDMFKGMTDLYSAFDDAGLPTHDKAGEPLAKAANKKLLKEQTKQKEAYEKYLASAAKNSA